MRSSWTSHKARAFMLTERTPLCIRGGEERFFSVIRQERRCFRGELEGEEIGGEEMPKGSWMRWLDWASVRSELRRYRQHTERIGKDAG